MTKDFNIRDSDWNPSYSHYLSYSDILREIADNLNLDLSTSINPVSMSKLKAVDSNYLYFLFDLFSFILFLELRLGLK